MTYEHQGRSRRRLTATVTDLGVALQRAFLIGVAFPDMNVDEAERSLEELALLTDTSGSDPVDRELVRRKVPDPATFIGRGKCEELARISKALDIDLVVFDNDLTPAQQRNLQKIFEVDVVDREGLILDIFAQHATSRAGAVQVELALYRYNLPRLRGRGGQLSQQGFGVLARGPGETKLETDRRRILGRIAKLERELKDLRRKRATQRKARKRNALPQVALVGYTNAGKSTLLNRLTTAEVLTEDRLFSTLDSTVRRTELPEGRVILLSDTVGFVRRLPHQLVEAFHSTLDDVKDADMLLHLVDGSDPDPAGQIAAVRAVLDEIEAHGVPELLVINKADVMDPIARERLTGLYPDAPLISARSGEGIDRLLEVLGETFRRQTQTMHLLIPYDRGDIVAAAHRLGEVASEKHDSDGTVIDVRVPVEELDRFEPYEIA